MLSGVLEKNIKTLISLLYLIFPRNELLLKHSDGTYLFKKIVTYWAKNTADFFFVQVGSSDGVELDPLNPYVHKYHWSGILIEPVKYVFNKLISNYRGLKNLEFVNMAVSEEDGFRDFYYLKETSDPDWFFYKSLGSFLRDVLLRSKRDIPDIEKRIVSEKVPTITLKNLLGKYKVKKIDLLHIDAEGYDYEILKQIRLLDIKPKMILFETKHLCDSDYAESKQFLRAHNYTIVDLDVDAFAFPALCFWDSLKIIFHAGRGAGRRLGSKIKAFLKKAFLVQKFSNIITTHKVYSLIDSRKDSIGDERATSSGVVHDSELKLLKELVEYANTLPGPIIEIGTLFGYSTRKIALWKLRDKKLVTVDNYCWNPHSMDKISHFKLTKRVLSPLIKNENVIQVRMDKYEFYRTYSGEAPAMVFLDANHDYEPTKTDIDWARKACAKIICGHDYSEHHAGVVKAVDESGKPDRLCGSLWVL